MAQKPKKNTEPVVQLLFLGHSPKGLWGASPCWRRALCLLPAERLYMVKKIVIILAILLVGAGCNSKKTANITPADFVVSSSTEAQPILTDNSSTTTSTTATIDNTSTQKIADLQKQVDELKKQNNKTANTKSVSPSPAPAVNPTPIQISPTPIPTPTPSVIQIDNSKNIADVIAIIDKAMADLNNYKSQISQLGSKMVSDYTEFSPYLTSAQATAWYNTLYYIAGQDDSLNAAIQTYQKNLQTLRGQVAVNFDYSYWANIGIPDIVNHQKQYLQQLVNLTSTYSQSLTNIQNTIHNNLNYTPPPVYYTSPPVNSQCANVEQQVRDSITAGGGFATESQIQALIINKKKELGCY